MKQSGQHADSPGSAVSHRRWPALRRWLDVLGRAVLPSRCVLCGATPDQREGSLCTGCRGDLRENRPCCPTCAEPLVRPEPLCGRCLKRPPPFDHAFTPWRYAWPLDGLITRFKFSGDLAAGRTLAELFVARWMARDDHQEQPPRLLVPVPLHRQRLRQRGYDQARELARDIGRELGLPVAAGLLRRCRATAAQTELDLKGRRRNVRGAFAVDVWTADRYPDRPSLALVDDVMTTGSTLAECARVLRQAGFGQIQAWAMVRAPARHR